MSSKHLFSLGMAVAALFLARPSFADVIATSSGTFSDLGGCTSSECKLASGGTVLEWGSTSNRNTFVDPSTLTADTVAIHSAPTEANVTLATLTWSNVSPSHFSPGTFSFDYTLTISFTSPASPSTVETFDLTLDNGTNKLTGFTLSDLSGLSFDVAGETFTDLRYVTGGDSSLSTFQGALAWLTPSNKTGTLSIVADIVDPPIDVPEPGPLAILATGLIGLGLLHRRPRLLRNPR